MKTGKITFEIHYEEGVLPEVFPEARTRVSRAARATAKVATPQPAEGEGAEVAESKTEATTEESSQADEIPAENPGESTTEEIEPEGTEAAYKVTGVRRKELAVTLLPEMATSIIGSMASKT